MNQGVEAGQERRFHRVLSGTFGLCCNALLIATFLLAPSPVLGDPQNEGPPADSLPRSALNVEHSGLLVERGLETEVVEFEVTWTLLSNPEGSPGRGFGTLPLNKDGKFYGSLSSRDAKIHVSGQLIGQSLELIGSIRAKGTWGGDSGGYGVHGNSGSRGNSLANVLDKPWGRALAKGYQRHSAPKHML